MEVSQGSGVCAALCIRRTLCRHVTIGTLTVIFCCLAVFWLLLTVLTNGTLYQSSKTLKTIGVPIVTGLPKLYQQCTNGVPIVKSSQKTVKTAKMTIGVPIVTCLPRLYQQCTNNVPIVKNSQKTVKTAKMTIGVPIVTNLPRLYNSVPIVKNSQNTVKTAQKWPLVYQSSQVYQDCTNSVTIVYQSSTRT